MLEPLFENGMRERRMPKLPSSKTTNEERYEYMGNEDGVT